VITSRHQLSGLVAHEGARPVALDVLSSPEARALQSSLVLEISGHDIDPAVAEVSGSGRVRLADHGPHRHVAREESLHDGTSLAPRGGKNEYRRDRRAARRVLPP
jgi:hypothetical protein